MDKLPIITVREHRNLEDPREVTKEIEFDLSKPRDWFRFAWWQFSNLDILPIELGPFAVQLKRSPQHRSSPSSGELLGWVFFSRIVQ